MSKVALVHLVHQLRGGDRRGRVHPHIQGSLRTKTEAALGLIELEAGEPEVEEHTVHLRKPCLAGEDIQVGEITLHEHWRRLQAGRHFPDPQDGIGITIDPEQPAPGQDSLEQRAGVASASQGAVDEDRTRPGLKELYCFF